MKANGTDLLTYADSVRVLNEGGNAKRGPNFTVANRHGEWSNPDKWFAGGDLLLEIAVKRTNDYANLTTIQRLLTSTTGLVTLERTTTTGTFEAYAELLSPASPTQNPNIYLFTMRVPSGSWRDKTGSTASGTTPSVTTLGDRPIDDMVVTFSGVGSATHTDASGVTSVLTIDAAAGAGTYIVDCGARTVTKSGSNQDRYLTVTRPWWWRFSPGATQTISATVSITVDWKNRWSVG